MPDINTLIEKSDYDIKIAEIESKYVSNTRFNSKLAQANVITKGNFDAKIIDIKKTKKQNKKNTKMKKLQTFDWSYFRDKSYFEEDGTQNYLVFQAIIRYFKIIAKTKYILPWKSKGLSDETITPDATSDNSLTPLIDH